MVDRVRRSRPEKEETHEETVTVLSSAFGVEENKRETRCVHKFLTEPAYIRVNAGTTKNLGNYESLRLDVALTVPCYVEEIPEVFERVADEVANLLDEELKKYES